MTVRVRFAPSPTGFLHVGGLRTALYNYLFAKKHNGTFILRIEDTDRKRLVEGSQQNLIDSLKWAGIDFDEGPGKEGAVGPYIQSQRLDVYQKFAQQLLDQGHAYYAFDTPEELTKMRQDQIDRNASIRKYERSMMNNSLTWSEQQVNQWLEEKKAFVIRLKVPEDRKEFEVNDLIHGKVTFQADAVDDQILLKQDGFPTYHLACIVDDHLMNITHVIRGEEWLPSTPKHLLLYELFGWEAPQMVHLPLLLNPGGGKLSKRENDVWVELYQKKGYLPEALVNFIALLGWNPGDEQEFFSINTLIEQFSLPRVNNSGAVFNVEKLDWLNKHHLRNTPIDTLASNVRPLFEQSGYPIDSTEQLQQIISLLIERVTVLPDFVTMSQCFFEDPDTYDEKTIKKRWKARSPELLLQYASELQSLSDFSCQALKECLEKITKQHDVGMGQLMLPTRLALSGTGSGPDLFEIMKLLGPETCIRRMKKAAQQITK